MLNWFESLQKAWRGEVDLPPALAFAVSLVCVAASTAGRYGLSLVRQDVVPFTTYYPAVIIATVFGGPRWGAFTAVLGGILGIVLEFEGSPGRTALITLGAVYVFACFLMIWGITRYRSIARYYHDLSQRLAEEEGYRKLVIGELEHRLKNKLATVHAVVHQALHNAPAAWAQVDGRIRALGRTDELIARADRHGCDFEELLKLELEPYGSSRISLLGEPLHLPSKLAVTLALVFHELATNAAKYGALASSAGTLTVSWRTTGDRLEVNWDESPVRPITVPDKAGFGTKLLGFALSPFDGKVQVDYLPTGLHCVIACKIPPAE